VPTLSTADQRAAGRVVSRLATDHHVEELEAAGVVKRLLGATASESVIRDHRDRVLSHVAYVGLVAGNVFALRGRHRYRLAQEAERRARLDALMGDLAPDPQVPVDEVLTETARAKAAAAKGTSPQRRAQKKASRNGAHAGETT
jgi:hypothetical protein